MQQLRTEIQQLENIANRTAQQEQELETKKKQLNELQNNPQENAPTNSNKTNYWLWILGGIGTVAIIGTIIYLVYRNRKNDQE